jgi:PncC family amidohydrolase
LKHGDASRLRQLAAEVVERLTERGQTLALAEAGTGGLIGYLITLVPGCSRVFPGGVIAYSNDMKIAMGVPETTLARFGAVSAEAAEELAASARLFAGSLLGLGLTSIAGPGGGSAEKPVGLTHIAVTDGERTLSEEHVFGEDRDGNMTLSAEAALRLVLRFVA